jgi:hypothetical protein
MVWTLKMVKVYKLFEVLFRNEEIHSFQIKSSSSIPFYLMFYCDEKSVDWQGAAKQVLNKYRTL